MNLLNRFRIRTKLASMVAMSVIAVCTIIAVTASLSRQRMLDARIAQLRTGVDMVIGLAQTLQDDVTAGKMTLPEAQLQFRMRTRKMKFDNGQGYAMAFHPDGVLLMNAANPQLEGVNNNTKDANGVVIADAVNAAGRRSPEGGIASYHYPRPGQKDPLQKIVFARKFAPWDIVVGVGLYVDDLDSDVYTLLTRLSAVGAGVIAQLALLSWLIARDTVS